MASRIVVARTSVVCISWLRNGGRKRTNLPSNPFEIQGFPHTRGDGRTSVPSTTIFKSAEKVEWWVAAPIDGMVILVLEENEDDGECEDDDDLWWVTCPVSFASLQGNGPPGYCGGTLIKIGQPLYVGCKYCAMRIILLMSVLSCKGQSSARASPTCAFWTALQLPYAVRL